VGGTPKIKPGDNSMKKLLTTVALVAVVATPALAQTRDRAPHRTRPATVTQPYTAQDQQQRRSANPSNDVYDIHGAYVGSDPDPTIRAQLANDPSQGAD
jgi:Flp pilus assembly protein TadD